MSARRQKRVFILSGGAALGAHHVGALRYLEERGIKPDAIIGSSIGVINACCYGSGGVPGLQAAWNEFRSFPRILDLSLLQNPLLGQSFFSMDKLSRSIEQYIDFPKIFESRLELEFILLNLSRGRGEVYSKRDCRNWTDLRTIARAGYAIPLLFPPVRFRGDLFFDGGFAWNVPLDHALTLKPTEIYILAPIASELPYATRLGSMLQLVRRFVDVMWRTVGNMGYLYAHMENGMFHGVPVTIIEPTEQWSGFSTLGVFHAYPAKSRRLMEAGYRDAKRALARQARRSQTRQGAAPSRKQAANGEPKGAAASGADGLDSKVISLRRRQSQTVSTSE